MIFSHLFRGPSGVVPSFLSKYSINFDEDDIDNFRHPGNTLISNQKAMTLSYWYKTHRAFDHRQHPFSHSTDTFRLQYRSDSFRYLSNNGTRYETVDSPEDVDKWVHTFCIYDTDNGTAQERIRAFINGVRGTNTNDTPSGGLSHKLFNSAGERPYMGRDNTATYPFGCGMYDFIFLDGNISYTPDDFGEDVGGRWLPKDIEIPEVDFGNNGFRMNFNEFGNAHISQPGDLVWTVNNFADIDKKQNLDTPHNNLACLYNGGVNAKTQLTVREGIYITHPSNDGNQSGYGAGPLIGDNKIYYEVDLPLASKTMTMGVATLLWNGGTSQVGWNDTGWSLKHSNAGNYLFLHDGSETDTGVPVADGDIGMVAMDQANGRFWGGVNGVWLLSGDPAIGANPVYTNLPATELRVGCSKYTKDTTGNWFNFGHHPFTYTPPAGFGPVLV